MKFTGFRNAAAGCFIAVMTAGVPAAAEAGMYYAGTSNNWTFQPMNYDNYANAWYIDLYLSGNGDNGGSQRFKITDSSGWNGNVWGSTGGRRLCNDQNRCGDIRINGQGQYRITVSGNKWSARRIDGRGNRRYNNNNYNYNNNGYYDDGYYDNGGAASDTLDRIENSRPVRKLRDGVRIIDDVSSLFGD